MLGMETLSLARHGAGVGGFGALFLWIERRHGVNPGKIQLGIDTVIFTASCAIIAPSDLLWSGLATLTRKRYPDPLATTTAANDGLGGLGQSREVVCGKRAWITLIAQSHIRSAAQ